MKKTTIISCIIFLLLLAAGGYYVIQPEITPRKILSSIRSLFETKEETRNRRIREAMECKPDKPPEQGRTLCAGDEGILATAGERALVGG